MNDTLEILLVEDSPYDAELAIRALSSRQLAKNLVHVSDGQEALDFLLGSGAYDGRDVRHKPKVILLDLKLPKVDGIEVLRRIRSEEGLRLIPVVMLTSSPEQRDLKAAYELGVNSYVVKPVEFENFLEVISNLGLYWLTRNEVPNP